MHTYIQLYYVYIINIMKFLNFLNCLLISVFFFQIVSFLWINSPPSLPQSDLDLALRYRLVQPSSLFHIFLYSDPSKEKVSFLNTLQYTG